MNDALKGKSKIFAVIFCCLFMVVLTGCGMKTDMNISDGFAGERVIVCDELADSDMMFSSVKVKDITESLKKNCPEQMEFSCNYTDGKQTKAVYTFKIKFENIDEYKSKVTAILGRAPSVEFTYQSPEEQLFKSGFSLSENFNSADLLSWVKGALKKDLNISKDLSSFNDTVSVTMNGTKFDNQNMMSACVKIDTVAAYKLNSVTVNTVRYGDDDYEREIILSMPQKTVETLGKENIQSFLESVTAENANGQWMSDENKLSRYRISFSGTAENINACTSKIFGNGSSFGYRKDESLYTAFSETGVLSENFNFDKFPCENNGTCNADITYKNMDASEFDGEKSTLSGAAKAQKGEGLSKDKKMITLAYRKAANAEVTLYSSTVYKLSEVDVVTEVSGDDKVRQSVILASPIDTHDYGAQFAASYFNRVLEGSSITVTVEQFNNSGSQYAVVLSTPSDTAENVTALFQKYLGRDNSVIIQGQDKFAFYNNRNISVTVDVAELIKPSQYSGEIMYSYKGGGQAYDVDWTADGGAGKTDVLMGAYRSDTFEHPISAHSFTVTYHVRRINVMFVMLVSALVIVVCGIVIMGICWLVLRNRRKNEETRLAAVQTMALVTLPDGTETMMEVTPEEAANTVVIMPKNDDGLDEDDDEPENVWLFATALKLFSAMGAVLFFLSFATVTWTDVLTKSNSISGLDLVKGISLMDRMLEGSYMHVFLLLAPLIIFALLSLRKYIPKVMSGIAGVVLSALQIWYLLGLPGTLEEQVNAFAAEVSKRITLEMGWAYNYSVMIYILLLLGNIVLMMIDAGLTVRRGIVKYDKNSKQNK